MRLRSRNSTWPMLLKFGIHTWLIEQQLQIENLMRLSLLLSEIFQIDFFKYWGIFVQKVDRTKVVCKLLP